jgi:SprT protein
LFARYFDDNLQNTIPHEVAHYVVDVLHGMRDTRPHGKEWQKVMHVLGAVPQRTHQYDLQGIPQRRQRRFTYHCGCNVYQLTTRRHNLILNGERRYLCRSCNSELQLKEA